jgi:hypothetical protein
MINSQEGIKCHIYAPSPSPLPAGERDRVRGKRRLRDAVDQQKGNFELEYRWWSGRDFDIYHLLIFSSSFMIVVPFILVPITFYYLVILLFFKRKFHDFFSI